MMIGNTRFWKDGLSLRSSNRTTHTQPFECGLSKWWKLPGFKIYETEADRGGSEIRLTAEVLWFYVNMLLFFTSRETHRYDDSGRSWGFYFMDRCNFVWRWGKTYTSWDLPFVSLVFLKHEILSLDRKRVKYLHGNGIEDYQQAEGVKKENSATFAYRYECIKGEVQNVQATVYVERWTHRWKWTPFKRIVDSIWVTFSDEVGPQKGSWKGGVTGCGWNLKPGETVIQCLRRMESERRFER